MGICASCLGGQPQDPVEQDEVESGPLLFSVPNGMHYGSFAEPQMAPHNNPSEARRETEALQRVVVRTSDGMVDVYDTTPSLYPRRKLGGVRDRQAQYQFLLSKVASHDTLVAGDGSLSMDEEDGSQSEEDFTQIKVDCRKGMVGSFREAAAAMA
ncbi:hypothetical protein Daus18300_005125 [Diaporthe australafricana]|uniref:Uncharacterized protein n=1 Tax=Diaporthe australafricana TaxID=127596 RepID=A0ABR3X487_9PEZI